MVSSFLCLVASVSFSPCFVRCLIFKLSYYQVNSITTYFFLLFHEFLFKTTDRGCADSVLAVLFKVRWSMAYLWSCEQ